MDESEVKIVIGQAVGRAYNLDRAEKSIPMLQRLFEEPQRTELERASSELLASDNFDEHTVAFILQASLQTDLPNPAPIDWRDLALDIRELENTVADYMYRLEREMENKDKVTESDKPAMAEMHDALREWANSLGSVVSHMREENWIEAKVEVDKAFYASQSQAIDALKTFYENPILAEVIDRFRDKTKQFHETILRYPSRMIIPKDRVKTILDVQAVYLRLQQLYFEDRNREANQVIGYPIEKLGDAIDFLLQTSKRLETANYEIGLGVGNLRRGLPKINDPALRRVLVDLADRLDTIFSSLPAEPWPMKDYGHPDVESRFDSDPYGPTYNHGEQTKDET
ncbi:MAG: hypothetical protein ABSA50_01350 [Candidatus Bathyarchaeia archaeon]